MRPRRPTKLPRRLAPADIPEVAARTATPAQPPDPPQQETPEEEAVRKMFEAAYT